MSDLNEKDIEVFIHAIQQYFKQTTREEASIRAAYLIDTELPVHDFTGLINVSADFKGCIYFSAPRVMMRHLLTSMMENNQSDENLLDAVGEIANTISGNARKHFGENMEISIPEKILGLPQSLKQLTRARPYAIDIKWKQYTASLIVDITRLQ